MNKRQGRAPADQPPGRARHRRRAGRRGALRGLGPGRRNAEGLPVDVAHRAQAVQHAVSGSGEAGPETAAAAPSPATPKMAKLQVLSGAFAGKELELTKALTTLGRPGVQVAGVTRRAEGYYIVHVDSLEDGNYPVVNGKRIGPRAQKLEDNDVIELAGVKMGFFLK